MTTTYDWPTVRAHATEAFAGDTPGSIIEAAILVHFQAEPAKVMALINGISRRVASGNIKSGWAILRHELDHQPATVQAKDDTERHKAVAAAEAWLKNTGGYLDREDELLSELYDPDIGRLRHWPDTKARILNLWKTLRPRFEAAEAASIERQHAQAQLRKRLRKAVGTGHPINTDLHVERVAGEIERSQGWLKDHAAPLDPAELAYLDSIILDTEEEDAA